ncbi:MAG: phosphatidate cytidylyltransferase [Planctomycetota bacterium]|jgi:phosphatidate cytidylyltransferase
MNERLFGYQHAFDHQVTVWLTVFAAGVLVIAPLFIAMGVLSGRIGSAQRTELRKRYLSWLLLAPLMVVPILLGAFWMMLAVMLLSILCYREYARVTGCFRHRMLSLVVVAGMLLVFFAVFDHWYGLFVAAAPLTVGAISVIALIADEPKGALGVLGFMLFGVGLGHLAYFGNDAGYRPMLLMLVVGIQMNDVFAYVSGKLFGRRKLVPKTSPNKTWGGSLGALVLTTSIVAVIAHYVFEGSRLDHPLRLITFGLIVSVLGQLGDLMLSSIKRDVGIKDTGQLIPGHGGLLDRFDSTLLVAPAAFHFIGYFNGIGLDQAPRILTG